MFGGQKEGGSAHLVGIGIGFESHCLETEIEMGFEIGTEIGIGFLMATLESSPIRPKEFHHDIPRISSSHQNQITTICLVVKWV